MSEGDMRIALVQSRCALGDKQGNIESMKKALAAVEADLFVFCELYLTGYMVRDQVHRLAERLDGRSVSKISDLAEEHGCGILFGMAREDDELPGVIKNSAVLVSEDGVQSYDKVHPATFGPFEEGLYFAKGDAPSMMEFRGVGFGACICYDLFHSEMARAYALGGAEVLVCLSASPYTSREAFERIIPARAVENTHLLHICQSGGDPAQPGLLWGLAGLWAKGGPAGEMPLFPGRYPYHRDRPERTGSCQKDEADGPGRFGRPYRALKNINAQRIP